MSKSETVTIVPVLAPTPEGIECYYLSDLFSKTPVIKMGTCVRCEGCNKACAANSVTVLSFDQKHAQVPVRVDMYNAEELSYYEQTHQALCDDCGNKLPDTTADDDRADKLLP